jgi:hypothetical protein
MQGRAHVTSGDNNPVVLGNEDIVKIQNFLTKGLQFGPKIDKNGQLGFQIGTDLIATDFKISGNQFIGEIGGGIEQSVIKYPFDDDRVLQITVKHNFEGRYHRKIEGSAPEKVAEFVRIVVASGENREEAYNVFLEKNPDVEEWIGGIAGGFGIFVNAVIITAAVVGIVFAAAAAIFGPPGDEPAWIAAITGLVKVVTGRLGIA